MSLRDLNHAALFRCDGNCFGYQDLECSSQKRA